MNQLIKLSVLILVAIAMSACGKDSGDKGKTGGGLIPELQKPAQKIQKETFSCNAEYTAIVEATEDGKKDVSFVFSKNIFTGVRIVKFFENGYKTHETTGKSEHSACYSYQDHCNQKWYTSKHDYSSNSIVHITKIGTNVEKDSSEVTFTNTNTYTDYADKSKLNVTETKKYSNYSIYRVDGEYQYSLEDGFSGRVIQYNENYVKHIVENKNSRTETTSLAAPHRIVQPNGDAETTIKVSETCVYNIENM